MDWTARAIFAPRRRQSGAPFTLREVNVACVIDAHMFVGDREKHHEVRRRLLLRCGAVCRGR
jgi:hypothetical protein